MILPHQFFAGILADFAEFIVGVDNLAAVVGNTDDGMLIQREFLKFKLQK